MPQGNIPHFSVRRLIKIHKRVNMLTLYYRFSQVNEAAYPAEHGTPAEINGTSVDGRDFKVY